MARIGQIARLPTKWVSKVPALMSFKRTSCTEGAQLKMRRAECAGQVHVALAAAQECQKRVWASSNHLGSKSHASLHAANLDSGNTD